MASDIPCHNLLPGRSFNRQILKSMSIVNINGDMDFHFDLNINLRLNI